jgi:hypothetical protein
MAKDLIETIKLEINGEHWNDVTLSEYHQGRRIEHIYHSVPKKVVMKLLNASSNPTVSDFDGWLKEEEEREKKKGPIAPCGEVSGNSWYDRN